MWPILITYLYRKHWLSSLFHFDLWLRDYNCDLCLNYVKRRKIEVKENENRRENAEIKAKERPGMTLIHSSFLSCRITWRLVTGLGVLAMIWEGNGTGALSNSVNVLSFSSSNTNSNHLKALYLSFHTKTWKLTIGK